LTFRVFILIFSEPLTQLFDTFIGNFFAFFSWVSCIQGWDCQPLAFALANDTGKSLCPQSLGNSHWYPNLLEISINVIQ